MWVLEKDASQLWCPQSGMKCQGKSCMAWRWGYFKRIDTPNWVGESYTAEEVGLQADKFTSDTKFYPRKGYCGLGGIPS